MAATVEIVRKTGAGPTATDITGINTRANAEDAHTTAWPWLWVKMMVGIVPAT